MASFSVVNNVAAANAQANLGTTNMGLQTALTRLSSGLRINNSGDDAAGLAVANSYRSKVAVLNQGIRNANDGLSTLQIKDGALNNISNLLDRLSTLATQSASSRRTVDRTKLNTEFQVVLTEIDREATVAGLTATASFSVFVSNDGTNGMVGGTIAPRPTPRPRRPSPSRSTPRPTRRPPSAPSRRRSARSAPRRATSARSRTVCSSPSAWRSRSRSTTRRPRAGFATPTSRKSRRTMTQVQHPDAERHRGPVAGQPELAVGPLAPPVTARGTGRLARSRPPAVSRCRSVTAVADLAQSASAYSATLLHAR